jgi:TRAP-type C4-dicarboxylate transport system substrate-binding protein
MRQSSYWALVAASFVVATQAHADDSVTLRVSLDTAPSHVRNVAIADYVKRLEDATGGRIKAQIFASAQLFGDRDVAKALRQGGIDMAAPGAWYLSSVVPSAGVLDTPIFFGRTLDAVHRVVDGAVGQKINGEVEQKTGGKVLGRWLDLGSLNIYSTKRAINTVADLEGLKLRSPGGVGMALRASAFGAIANTTPWSDVPLALSQGNFDALVSTDETLTSGKLWEAGIKHAFVDREYPALYIPVVSGEAWKKLKPEDQKLMIDLWAENINRYRDLAREAQEKARAGLVERGVVFVTPTEAEADSARAKLLSFQDKFAQQLKLSPEIVDASKTALAAIN